MSAGIKQRRTTGRVTNVSSKMAVLDEDARQEARNSRLDALEADNYMEETGERGDDAAYVDSEDEGHVSKKAAKRKLAQKGGGNSRIAKFKAKSLTQWVFEAGLDASGASGPNYSSVAAAPSRFPARHYCSVCGTWGHYTCTRCGQRYCCSKCLATHKETRCLKMAV